MRPCVAWGPVWQHLNLAPAAGMAAHWWQLGAFELTAAVNSIPAWCPCMASSTQAALRRIWAANDHRCLEVQHCLSLVPPQLLAGHCGHRVAARCLQAAKSWATSYASPMMFVAVKQMPSTATSAGHNGPARRLHPFASDSHAAPRVTGCKATPLQHEGDAARMCLQPATSLALADVPTIEHEDSTRPRGPLLSSRASSSTVTVCPASDR